MTAPCASSTLEILDRLVAFDTTSRNSNLGLVAHARQWLEARGGRCLELPDATGRKANLLVVFGPPDQAGLILSGHTDVVPIDGQRWSGDAFTLRREAGRVVGRGVTDMKGFVAAAMAAAARLEPARLKRPLILALSHDEEVGCKGVPALIDAYCARFPPPIGCVVGEPTGMAVVDGHKGKIGCRVEVVGLGGHSSLAHQTVNAVVEAARLIGRIAEMSDRARRDGPFAAGFHPAWTTGSIGRIEGGSELNVVPDRCVFEFEFRTIPGVDPRACAAEVERFGQVEVLPRMREVAPEAEIRFTEILAYPAFEAARGTEIVQVCLELTGTERPLKVPYGTEAGCFAARGISAVVCGPGDIAQAHKPDEWIALDQLATCDRFLERLIARLCY